MGKLHKYIINGFLVTFFMALLVLSFVMSVGLLYKATTLLSRGASATVIFQYIWSGFPFTLSYSIPIALLVSSLLVFGRLSSDSEITAMRACGVSLWMIMRTPLAVSVFFSVFCLFLNNDVAPESSYSRKSLRKNIGVAEIAAMIEPGRVIEDDNFPGYSFYVQERDGDVLRGVKVVETLEDGSVRELVAKEAVISLENGNQALRLDMKDVSINTFPMQTGIASVRADSLPYLLENPKASGDKPFQQKRRVKDKPTWVLVKDVYAAKIHPPRSSSGIKDISRSKVEITSRIALALACFCFVFVGIPLGIKQHRRESSVGIGISLGVAGAFYLFAILGESLSKSSGMGAEYVVLVPVLLCLVLGAVLVAKNN